MKMLHNNAYHVWCVGEGHHVIEGNSTLLWHCRIVRVSRCLGLLSLFLSPTRARLGFLDVSFSVWLSYIILKRDLEPFIFQSSLHSSPIFSKTEKIVGEDPSLFLFDFGITFQLAEKSDRSPKVEKTVKETERQSTTLLWNILDWLS